MIRKQPKKTKRIMVCLNTPQSVVKEVLKQEDYLFQLILDPSQKIVKQKKTIFGFTSSEIMIPFLPLLKRPPILWESASIIRHLALNQPIILLDAKITNCGLIFFQKLDEQKLLKAANRKFAFKSDIKFEKLTAKQFGNGSKLSILINSFLSTLPEYVHEPTIIALVTAIENGEYKLFDEYIATNRLLTNENKNVYTDLSKYLTEIRTEIDWLLKKDLKHLRKIKDKNLKGSLARVRFLIKYFGTKDLSKFLDKEDNVNIKKEEK